MTKLKSLPARLGSAPQRLSAVSSSSWRAGKESRESRGYDRKWKRYRLSFLSRHPLCVMCTTKGLVTAATIVDHRIPHQGDMAIFWDTSNHQSLCKPCHDGEKARQERELGFR